MASEQVKSMAEAVEWVERIEKEYKVIIHAKAVLLTAVQAEQQMSGLDEQIRQKNVALGALRQEEATEQASVQRLKAERGALEPEVRASKKIIAEGQEVEQWLPERKAELVQIEKRLVVAREEWAKFKSRVEG
ncbi:MAG: hypothetical protein O7C73_00245 [Nitrospirae bacterium]|nr:hypothetical protein [Acidobacteriota bacterium]MCZ6780055.1 hypothetical protein [Nitrospirota bacterium]